MSQELSEYWPHDLVAGETVNVRPDDADVSELVASIGAHGLLQPLVGRSLADGTVEIIDGNRRLKALKQLFDDGRRRERVPVMLRGQEAEADAYEISLAANVLRKALHPVREYEAFTALEEKGRTPQEIADHFGISLRGVQQRLALGRLHEDVRKAWVEGRVSGEAAAAFTLAPPDEQAAYLAGAKTSWQLGARSIREAFTQGTVSAGSARALYVGVEAYREAGGTFVADLFAEPDFADGALLTRLVNEKLATEAKRVAEEEGWSEVLFGEAADARYSWDRLRKPAIPEEAKPPRVIEIEARLDAIGEHVDKLDDALLEIEDEQRREEVEHDRDVLTEEEDRLKEELELLTEREAWLLLPLAKRAKAVATIRLTNDGDIEIQRGYLKDQKPSKPEPTALSRPEPKPAATPGEAEAPEPARLSAALLDELALTATRAAAHVLAEHPRIAMAAMVATAATWGSPLRLTHQGRGEGPKLPWGERDSKGEVSFAKAFREALGWAEADLHVHVARSLAHALDFTSKAIAEYSSNRLKPEAVQDLRCSLPADKHRAALVQAFDAEAYFTAAPKAEAIGAIADCGDEPAKHAKLKKGDLAAVAARLAKARAWLPPILRGEIFEAVLPEESVPEAPEPATAEQAPAPEDTRTAAEATLQIWLGEERTRLVAMKAPEIRDLLKGRGIAIPFGASKMQLIELALQDSEPPAITGEAA